jgi:cytochrome P450
MLQQEEARNGSAPAAAPLAGEMPPGPPLPRFMQTLGFIFAPAPFLDACRRRYGDVITMGTLFDPKFVMVFDPDVVKQVFRGPHEQLRAGEANAPLGPVLGARSVLLLDGDEHLRHRRLMLPSFHGERMREYERVMVAATDRVIDSWPLGETFRLLPSMQLLTLDVIMHAVFGVEEGPRQEELKRRVRTMLDPVGSRAAILLMMLSGGRVGVTGRIERFQRQRQAVDEMIYAEIAARRGAADLEERTDVLSMLLVARDEQGEPMTDAELRDELVTLLVAGHETTATGLAWAFELLLRNPDVLARTRAAVAEGDTAYMDAVVKETLRRRTVVPGVGRVVRGEPFALNGYVIPPGIEINPSIAGMHRRADSYPDPTAFRPERFLGDDAPDTYTWIPFGGGTRRCLGASFASFEMRVVISRVLERAQLTAVGRAERPVRKGVTIVPRNGVRVRQAAAPRPVSALTPAGAERGVRGDDALTEIS